MDSREAPPPQPNILMGPTSYSPNTMIPQQPPRFHFNCLAPHSPSQSQPHPQSKPIDSLSSNAAFDGSPSFRAAGGFGIDPNKKKRGRPRKYTPDGNIALRLAPTPSPASNANSGGGTPANSVSEHTAKRNRGRPPGSGKKQLDALGGIGGSGFTPHVITVEAGEDIASKIMAFSKQGPRTVCILSANGAVSNVSLRQPAMSGGTVTYEGRFEIISISGSFSISENNGGRSRSSGLSVSLAGSDGRVLGGGVEGMLMAASSVQIILGSFFADGKKPNSSILQPGASIPPNMLSFGAAMTSSPSSQGALSESSDDNGRSPSPLNRSGLYNNASQPLHNMQMYQLWAGQTQQ